MVNVSRLKLILLLPLIISLSWISVLEGIENSSIEFESGGNEYLLKINDKCIELERNGHRVFRYSTIDPQNKIMGEEKLTDFQRQSIDLIKTFSLQLILIASGVFSLTGIYLLKNPTKLNWSGVPFIIIVSYCLFAYSIIRGFMVLGNVVQQLSGGSFDPHHAALLDDARIQFYCVFIGGFIFIGAIFLNFLTPWFKRSISSNQK